MTTIKPNLTDLRAIVGCDKAGPSRNIRILRESLEFYEQRMAILGKADPAYGPNAARRRAIAWALLIIAKSRPEYFEKASHECR